MEGDDAISDANDKEEQIATLRKVMEEGKEMLKKETEKGAIRQELKRLCKRMNIC